MPIPLYAYPTPENLTTALSKPREDAPPLEYARTMGNTLFGWLMAGIEGGVATWRAALEETIAEETYVQLNLISGDAEVQAVPWEMLYHPDLGFLATASDVTLVRRWKAADTKPKVATALPLRVLLFIASPTDLDPERSRLDFENEENFLFAQIAEPYGAGRIDVDVAEDGTLQTLQERLTSQAYDVVHLSMHGEMGKDGAALVFEDAETGQTQRVTPQEIIDLWKRSRARAACFVLSACQTAMGDTERAIPSFAEALVKAGVPHVVGMQRSVGDKAATYFTGHLYRLLAEGWALDEAVRAARQAVAEADTALQWTIPVLFSRKPTLAAVDPALPFELQEKKVPRQWQIGEVLFRQGDFIGRRAIRRRYERRWVAGQTPHLLFYGTGGVGKTTTAGHFAFRFKQRYPEARFFAFAPPFELDHMEQTLREAFLQDASPADADKWQQLEDVEDRLALMWAVLSQKPCVCVFDNLETGLDLETRMFGPVYAPVVRVIAQVLRQPGKLRALLTCRYLPEEPQWNGRYQAAQLPEAGLGDVVRFMRDFRWPAAVTTEHQREMYRKLGGNFRAVGWVAGLLTHDDKTWADLRRRLDDVMPPDGTPAGAVETALTAMRRDLVLAAVLDQLSAADTALLRHLSLAFAPVIEDALFLFRDDPSTVATTCKRWLSYGLVEVGQDPALGWPTYHVPRLVAELLGEQDAPPDAYRATHALLGEHWRYRGEHQSRCISDDLVAILHFTEAEAHDDADALRMSLGRLFNERQEYPRAIEQVAPVTERGKAPNLQDALHTLGFAHHNLGQYAEALKQFEEALAIRQEIGDRKGEGTTLNNISQIHKVRGDYETALVYLKQSLAIQQEIEDRQGEGATLNNLATTAYAGGDYETALVYLKQSLAIRQEIGDRQGEGATLNNISQIHKVRGDYETALVYVKQSLAIRQEIGDRKGEIATLNNIAGLAEQAEDWEQALSAYSQAFVSARDIHDALGLFHVSTNLGLLLVRLGGRKEGVALLEQAHALGTQLGHPQAEQVGDWLKQLGAS